MCEGDAGAAEALKHRQDAASALKHNQETKGSNSYYYAHTRSYEVPPDAKVVEGPGLITGGPPVLLEKQETESSPSKGPVAEQIRNYAWTEEANVMKVSVDGGDAALATDDNVTCEFDTDSFTLSIRVSEAKKLQLSVPLKKSIDPEKCKFRVSKGKGVRVTLAKKEKGKWYDLIKPATK
jgi:hypothetical protein